LDVGCGVGKEVRMLIEDGYDAYGIDLPNLSPFWSQFGNSPQHFFCATGTGLPFPNDFFDVVYSFGVIEHIGTRTGHCTLARDYRDTRQQYANEILRVVKPQGRVIIACPNKSFPIDIQHDPGDELCSPNEIRKWIYSKTGINIHRVWGKYHLLSHNEMRMLFGQGYRLAEFKTLALKGYFGFGRFQKGFLRPFARLASLYVECLPRTLRSSPFNPYVLVEMRKSDNSL
jgi:SAM-dependent methyltransferase